MLVWIYTLRKDSTISTKQISDCYCFGYEGEVSYRIRESIDRIEHIYDPQFVSQIWLKERDDSKAIDILLSDRTSIKILEAYKNE